MTILDTKLVDGITYYIVSIPTNSVIKPIQGGHICEDIACSTCLFNYTECDLGIAADDDLRQCLYEHFPKVPQAYPEYFI